MSTSGGARPSSSNEKGSNDRPSPVAACSTTRRPPNLNPQRSQSHGLFGGTVVGFLASAALVLSVELPQPRPAEHTGGLYDKTTRGTRIYLATPRLRGLLALNLSVAAAGAMVIVNTVVIVRGLLSRPDSDVALARPASAAARCWRPWLCRVLSI